MCEVESRISAHVNMDAPRASERGVRSPRARMREGCEPLGMGTGN